ncbi:hypothetical protein ACPV48_17655, partial [Vibrio harveyi]|uniref:hypothetical protein n=1 Tax=Vibrio harveyi TaxID=669 RepID=UPI0040697CF3
GVWLSRYRLFLLKDKSGFPRKAAMNLFFANFHSLCPFSTSNARFFVWLFTISGKSGHIEIWCDGYLRFSPYLI